MKGRFEMTQQFQIGEYVRYGSNGVCQIDDIQEMTIAHNRDQYYILQPVTDQNTTFFIPMHNDALRGKIHPVLTREEVDAIIDSVDDALVVWIDDRKQRMERFRTILRNADPREILCLRILLFERKRSLAANGLRLSPSDNNLLKQVSEITDNEFSFALEISEQKVAQYIHTRIGKL